MKMRYKLLLLLLLCTIIPLSISVFVSYDSINNRLRNEMISQYKSQAEKLKQSFELSIRGIDNSILSIYQTSELYNFVIGNKQSGEETVERQRRIENLLKILAHSLHDYSYVNLYLNERRLLFRVNAKYLHVEQEIIPGLPVWAEDAQKKNGELVIVHNQPESLFIGRSVPDVIEKKQMGVIGVELDQQYFENIIGADNVLERVDILSSDGFVIYSTDAKRNMDGDQLIIESALNEYNWKIVTYLSQKTLNKIAWEAVRPTIVWGGLFLLVAIAAWVMLTREISAPLGKLVRNMREVGKGNFHSESLRPKQQRRDEFGFLEQQFYTMVVKIEELIKHEYQLKTNESIALMKALQAQINPHFLYNTLTSIYSEALETGAEHICHMVKSLAAMFRYTMEFKQDIVLLEDELAHMRNYLDIQKFRFEEQLQFYINIPPQLLKMPVAKLSLQPIVENAVVHGLAKSGHGMITITANMEADQVTVIVEDTAGLLSAKRAKTLNESIRSSKLPSDGVGMSNVHQRVQHHFPGSEGLSMQGEQGLTRVKLSWKAGEQHESSNR